MKILKTLIAATAVTLIGSVSVSAQAIPYDKPEIRKIDLCVKGTGKNCQKRPLTAAEKREMMEHLKKVNYPGQIVVNTKDSFRNVDFGWQDVLRCKMAPRDFRSLWPDMRTGNLQIDQARVTYCLMRKSGWPVAKPKIILDTSLPTTKR